jgi:hypothetical protein
MARTGGFFPRSPFAIKLEGFLTVVGSLTQLPSVCAAVDVQTKTLGQRAGLQQQPVQVVPPESTFMPLNLEDTKTVAGVS